MKLGPRTPLNVAITGKRSFATTQIPLSEAKALAKHFDVKLNDVILATVSGALRRFYADDKKILSKAMIGAVPASLRTPGDTSQSNQVTMMLINMATNIVDPTKRIAAIRASSAGAKMLTGSNIGRHVDKQHRDLITLRCIARCAQTCGHGTDHRFTQHGFIVCIKSPQRTGHSGENNVV